ERRASWLELFYDLVFVVVVAEVAHYLAEHVTPVGVLGYALLFLAVWWSWISGTVYTDRFETMDISYRLIVFLQMVPVAAMAIFAHDALGEGGPQFALAYVAARLLIIALWLRAGWHNPSFRPVSNRYAAGFGLSVALFVASVFVEAPLRYLLWGLALTIDLATPLLTVRQQRALPPLSSSHLPERFGLFVIIVLGEAIIGVVRGVAEQESFSPLTGLLGLALVFGLWWVYFDFVARRVPRPGMPQFVWTYLHLPLVMSIAAIGAGVLNVLTVAEDRSFRPEFLLMAGALALALVAIGLLEMTLRRDANEPTDHRTSVLLKFGVAALAVGVGVLGTALGTNAFLLALLALLLVLMVYGAYVWFHQAATSA
ncbi:MAG: low temperature requirement protein A, partial [Chloroflexales bacterium]|nr:low temperature requirement protein A [Chloroflexales bacterium]